MKEEKETLEEHDKHCKVCQAVNAYAESRKTLCMRIIKKVNKDGKRK